MVKKFNQILAAITVLRQIQDMAKPRHNQNKTQQTIYIRNACFILCYATSNVCHVQCFSVQGLFYPVFVVSSVFLFGVYSAQCLSIQGLLQYLFESYCSEKFYFANHFDNQRKKSVCYDFEIKLTEGNYKQFQQYNFGTQCLCSFMLNWQFFIAKSFCGAC